MSIKEGDDNLKQADWDKAKKMQDGVASQNGVADLEKDEERMVKNLVKAAKEPSLGFASHSQHLSHKNEHLVMMMMMMMMTMLLLLMMM